MCGWLKYTSAALLPGMAMTRYPFFLQAGWAPGPFWMGAENLIRSFYQSFSSHFIFLGSESV